MWNGFLYGWFEKVDFIRFMSVDIWIWITIIHLGVCKLLMRTSAWLAIFLTINHATRNINRVRYVNMINVLSIFLVIVKRILELSMPFTVKMKFTQTIRHWDLIKEVIVEKLNHFSRWKNIIPRHFPWFYYTGTIWTEKLRKNACFTQFKYESQKRDNVSFFFFQTWLIFNFYYEQLWTNWIIRMWYIDLILVNLLCADILLYSSGKTTLLSCIVGLRRLSKGKIYVCGKKPGEKGSGLPGRLVGYMPQVWMAANTNYFRICFKFFKQEVALNGEFTIREVCHYFGRIFGMEKDSIDNRIENLLNLLDLKRCNQYINTLRLVENEQVK